MKKLLLLLSLVLAACIDGPDEEPAIDAPIFDCVHDAPDTAIDAPIDAPDPCAACGVDQICVQFFNGTCGELSIACQDRPAGCDGTCGACDVPVCHPAGGPIQFSCATSGCPDENPAAFHCYGV